MSTEYSPVTLFPLPVQEGVRLHDLRRLFALVDWGVVLLDPRIEDAYGTYPPVSMFKALSLPFLLNIPTERALARELEEKGVLRVLCGFEEAPPTRGMLWNFRHNPPVLYPSIMFRVLIAIAVAGWRLQLSLPFIRETDLEEEASTDATEFDLIFPFGIKVRVWPNHNTTPLISTKQKSWDQVAKELRGWQKRASLGISKNLDLPAKVRLKISNIDVPYDIIIRTPEWLDSAYKFTLYGADTLTTIGSSPSDPYTACNVLVLWEENLGCKKILLAERLMGYGSGQYGLPGGKKRPAETLMECAKRELFEETGLEILESRPISVKLTHFPNRRPTWSIGVLATKYKGEPKRKEEKRHSDWKWYPLDALPTPLFEPARLVIEDYKQMRFEKLTWDDVEKRVEDSERTLHQRRLFD